MNLCSIPRQRVSANEVYCVVLRYIPAHDKLFIVKADVKPAIFVKTLYRNNYCDGGDGVSAKDVGCPTILCRCTSEVVHEDHRETKIVRGWLEVAEGDQQR